MSVPLHPPARRPPRCPLQRRWAVTPRGQPKLTRLRFVMEMLAGSFGSEVRCGGGPLSCPARALSCSPPGFPAQPGQTTTLSLAMAPRLKMHIEVQNVPILGLLLVPRYHHVGLADAQCWGRDGQDLFRGCVVPRGSAQRCLGSPCMENCSVAALGAWCGWDRGCPRGSRGCGGQAEHPGGANS